MAKYLRLYMVYCIRSLGSNEVARERPGRGLPLAAMAARRFAVERGRMFRALSPGAPRVVWTPKTFARRMRSLREYLAEGS